MISSLAQRALRVIKEEGWVSLFRKTKRKIRLYSIQKSSELSALHLQAGGTPSYSNDRQEKWLEENKHNFNNPFYILLKYLLTLNEQLINVAPLSSADYENYFKERCIGNDFPFESDLTPVQEKESIVEFINEFDYAYASKMIQKVFIPLIQFLVDRRGSIDLLDFGTGRICGMYGESGRFLFEAGKVPIRNINFFGIDDVHKPRGAIFEKSTYIRSNILSFTTDQTFDLITGHHVLEHCPNWEDVIKHVSNLLKPEGYLYLSFPRFGGFYDTVYRLMHPLDHCATFDINMVEKFARSVGMEMCFSDIYVDPNTGFNWLCSSYPDLVSKDMAKLFYDLCVKIDSKLSLGYHHYGHYVIFKKIK